MNTIVHVTEFSIPQLCNTYRKDKGHVVFPKLSVLGNVIQSPEKFPF